MTAWLDYEPLNGCSVCQSDFTSLSAFDAHRQGTYEPDTRHCVPPETVGLSRVAPGDSEKYDTRIASGIPLYWDAEGVEKTRRDFGKVAA